jgi:hypothetical protein
MQVQDIQALLEGKLENCEINVQVMVITLILLLSVRCLTVCEQ